MNDLRLRFVLSPWQNAFFGELADVICHELTIGGVDATVATPADVEPDADTVFVLLPPHEYVGLEGPAWHREPHLMGRTIALTAEQPSQPFFARNAELVARAGAAFDFSAHAVEAYRALGVRSAHLPFGYAPSWDRFVPNRPNPGPPEVLFLGSASERRAGVLAAAAWALSRHDCRLVISDNSSPNTGPSSTFLVGEAKRDLLCSARLLLNVHGGQDPYFEWLRLVEAMHCGTVVLTEPSVASSPYEPGVHVLSSSVDALPHVIEGAVHDDRRLNEVREAAYARLREQPLARTLDRLVGAAEALRRAPVPARVPPFTRSRPYPHPQRGEIELDTTSDVSIARQQLRELRMEMQGLRRELAGLTELVKDPDASRSALVQVVHTTAAWHRAEPELSVILALYNHADYVTAALDSLAANDQAFEVVVADDGSTDGSRATVSRWMEDHPWIPARLVGHRVNRGLPFARNTALAHARAPRVFVLDADNEVRPDGLRLLQQALDADPDAWFAYGLLERFDADGPSGLMDLFPWQPWRLRHANYIDAMALVRTHRLRQMGGYTTDRRLYGWEDYDLWCRMAEAGGRGAFVPNLVARYRVSATSMIALSNVSEVPARTALQEHAPRLMAGLVDDSA